MEKSVSRLPSAETRWRDCEEAFAATAGPKRREALATVTKTDGGFYPPSVLVFTRIVHKYRSFTIDRIYSVSTHLLVESFRSSVYSFGLKFVKVLQI
jgi:hypothetical protein